ncbi:MAG: hypothetical protein QXG26_02055 [Candidatus Aenigmatarchaeota archaeon]
MKNIYETEKVDIPEDLKQLGWKGKACCAVYDLEDGRYSVHIEIDFEEGVDPFNSLPTAPIFDNKENAIIEAEMRIRDIENWLKYDDPSYKRDDKRIKEKIYEEIKRIEELRKERAKPIIERIDDDTIQKTLKLIQSPIIYLPDHQKMLEEDLAKKIAILLGNFEKKCKIDEKYIDNYLLTLELNKIEAKMQKNDAPPIFTRYTDELGVAFDFTVNEPYKGMVHVREVYTEQERKFILDVIKIDKIKEHLLTLDYLKTAKRFRTDSENVPDFLISTDESGFVIDYKLNPIAKRKYLMKQIEAGTNIEELIARGIENICKYREKVEKEYLEKVKPKSSC